MPPPARPRRPGPAACPPQDLIAHQKISPFLAWEPWAPFAESERVPGWPAIVTKTVVTLDGQILGPWDIRTVRRLNELLPERPNVHTLEEGAVIGPGYNGSLIHLDPYDHEEQGWFWELISKRLQVTIHYESLYGGEEFVVTKRVSSP